MLLDPAIFRYCYTFQWTTAIKRQYTRMLDIVAAQWYIQCRCPHITWFTKDIHDTVAMA